MVLDEHVHYRNKLLQLLDSVRLELSAIEMEEVLHFIHHNENGEALRALAFIIEEEKKFVHASTLVQIGRLAAGLVSPSEMPESIRPYLKES